MRVLWFTNIPLDPMNRHVGRKTEGSGFWMHQLLRHLNEQPDISLAVATAQANLPDLHFIEDNVEFFNANLPRFGHYRLFETFSHRRLVRSSVSIVEKWQPDLIHVHGTERPFGLVKMSESVRQIPMVVSIQGIIAACERHAFGQMRIRDIVTNLTFWEISRAASPFSHTSRLRRQSKIEKEILLRSDGVMGRTKWDKGFCRLISPALKYFHVNELMRPEFSESQPWCFENCEPYRLFSVSSLSPRKGLQTLLQAIQILNARGLDVRLRVAGIDESKCNKCSHGKHLLKLMEKMQIKDHVDLVGLLNAEQLAQEHLAANCFVTPTYIDNSPNSLCEAQLLGVPCIATNVGGIPSLVESKKTGLLVIAGDQRELASKIESVLHDPDLATHLGTAARTVATRRHDPTNIVQSLNNCYQSVISTRTIAKTRHRWPFLKASSPM